MNEGVQALLLVAMIGVGLLALLLFLERGNEREQPFRSKRLPEDDDC